MNCTVRADLPTPPGLNKIEPNDEDEKDIKGQSHLELTQEQQL